MASFVPTVTVPELENSTPALPFCASANTLKMTMCETMMPILDNSLIDYFIRDSIHAYPGARGTSHGRGTGLPPRFPFSAWARLVIDSIIRHPTRVEREAQLSRETNTIAPPVMHTQRSNLSYTKAESSCRVLTQPCGCSLFGVVGAIFERGARHHRVVAARHSLVLREAPEALSVCAS